MFLRLTSSRREKAGMYIRDSSNPEIRIQSEPLHSTRLRYNVTIQEVSIRARF
jgi:hypothetical protein